MVDCGLGLDRPSPKMSIGKLISYSDNRVTLTDSRRDVLRTGARLAATGTIVGLAGCSDLPVVGGFFGESTDFLEWVYDPEEYDADAGEFW